MIAACLDIVFRSGIWYEESRIVRATFRLLVDISDWRNIWKSLRRDKNRENVVFKTKNRETVSKKARNREPSAIGENRKTVVFEAENRETVPKMAENRNPSAPTTPTYNN